MVQSSSSCVSTIINNICWGNTRAGGLNRTTPPFKILAMCFFGIFNMQCLLSFNNNLQPIVYKYASY